MSSAVISPPASKVKATFAAAYIAVALAQVTNALPGALNGTFQAEFQTQGSELVWISAMFSIPLVVFELTFGVLGDMFGRKRLLFIGSGFVVVGSVIAGLAPTTEWMWIAQAIGGIGAGILFPISLSMIAAITPDHHARARAIATWAGFLSLGAVISPVLAGVTSELFTTAGFSGWRVAYFIAAAIAVVVIVVGLGAQDSSAPEGRRLDIPGQVTFALGLIAVLYATVEGAESGWTQPHIVGAYAFGALLLVAFVIIELKTKAPLIHLGLFANRAFSVSGIVAVVGMFAFLAICFGTSVWVGALHQQPAIIVGVLFLFIQGPAFALIPLVSFLIRRVAARWVLTGGFASIAAGGFILSTYDVAVQEWTAFIAPLLLVGVGFAFTVGSITAAAINSVPLHYAGMASATTNLLRDLGFALGPVLGGAIAFSVARGVFGAAFPEVAASVGVPEAAAAELSHVPPIAFLSSPDLQAALPADGVGPVLGLAVGSLGDGFSTVFLVAAICAAASALLTLVALRGARSEAPITDDELAEIPEANAEAARTAGETVA